ncbi:MAG: flippase-like domain-containing protein [Syntrophales bacterium]|nr:flippase-like domain-containing protein [Syntrophales bacterium]
MKKFIVGSVISSFLIYLSFRDIPIDSVLNGFQNIKFRYLLLASSLMIIMQVIRSYRWGILLSPLQKVNFFTLFSVTNVGFLFIIAIPARLGELVRPYLISKKSNIPTGTALGTIIVERILDFLTLLLFLVFVLFCIPLPNSIIQSSVVIFILVLTVVSTLVILTLKLNNDPLSLVNRLSQSENFQSRVRNFLLSIVEGSKILVMPRILLGSFVFSLLFWLVNTLALYSTLKAVGLEISFIAALTVMIILITAISLPTAPGYLGNWHYACVFGLSIFGIQKDLALSFAIIYHFISIMITVLLGLPFLPSNSISIAELRKI